MAGANFCDTDAGVFLYSVHYAPPAIESAWVGACFMTAMAKTTGTSDEPV